jgi:hypothetical protein
MMEAMEEYVPVLQFLALTLTLKSLWHAFNVYGQTHFDGEGGLEFALGAEIGRRRREPRGRL